MFARNGSAKLNGKKERLGNTFSRTRDLRGVFTLDDKIDVDIAVARVAEICHEGIIAAADLLDTRYKLRHIGTRYYDIFIDLERAVFHKARRNGTPHIPKPILLFL